ncbi:MAG TPA: nucleotidyltransferase family protein [Methanoregulaceae archaeon]|nr:nucleotidyltransferase family protein [Methanoregulaceae archaeon]
MSSTAVSPPDPSLPGRLREFHVRLPLAGGRPNALLALLAGRVLSLVALLRDTPQPPPALSLEAWREFLDLLRPHGVYPLHAYRLRSWAEDGRPPLDVMDFLKRQHLLAAARAMRADRQIQQVIDALEAAGIPSEKAVLLHRKRTGPSLSERFASVENENGRHGRPGGAPALRVTGRAAGG